MADSLLLDVTAPGGRGSEASSTIIDTRPELSLGVFGFLPRTLSVLTFCKVFVRVIVIGDGGGDCDGAAADEADMTKGDGRPEASAAVFAPRRRLSLVAVIPQVPCASGRPTFLAGSSSAHSSWTKSVASDRTRPSMLVTSLGAGDRIESGAGGRGGCTYTSPILLGTKRSGTQGSGGWYDAAIEGIGVALNRRTCSDEYSDEYASRARSFAFSSSAQRVSASASARGFPSGSSETEVSWSFCNATRICASLAARAARPGRYHAADSWFARFAPPPAPHVQLNVRWSAGG
jgi:hypothetical protein